MGYISVMKLLLQSIKNDMCGFEKQNQILTQVANFGNGANMLYPL